MVRGCATFLSWGVWNYPLQLGVCLLQTAFPSDGSGGNQHRFMSQHRSLRASGSMAAKRNVLKRYERVEILRKAGEWKAGARVTGLRKTKPPV